ncbi:MAG: CBS domain-containing protein [Deltaproteobacteria bacterium]|nr:CBS domain-containing protein [Deltaproteobacteria bacterium]MBW2393679.1 CBS domain-containing protein [Deltaproteobacteria bacterium]
MTVARHCRKPASTIPGTETLHDAAEQMATERVGSLVVVKGRSPVGVVTDRDIALGVLARGLDPEAASVAEIASTPAVVVGTELPLREASATMRRHGLRRVPVVDGEGAVVGVLAGDDLVRLIALELTCLADVAAEQIPIGVRSGSAEAGPARDVEQYARKLTTIPEDASAGEVGRIMASEHIGCVVMVDRKGVPAGVVTDRDLVVRVVARGLGVDAPAAGAMSTSVVTIDARASLEQAASEMSSQGIRRLLVLREAHPVGIVTYDDLIVALGSELHDLGAAMQAAREREHRA